ncbi:hypothetical protein N658DRAFT_246723 [Parathielavia hyrcaniae]|uniref:Uncharacterized protein n=1 Tax=Parathielavia hyrcaniae TaxID=113614 RepID=A0AAN6Q609_9PEZI|nr:hypothetical protein N658DRAFT_246723 [Parathielavia hyrcaniae]
MGYLVGCSCLPFLSPVLVCCFCLLCLSAVLSDILVCCSCLLFFNVCCSCLLFFNVCCSRLVFSSTVLVCCSDAARFLIGTGLGKKGTYGCFYRLCSDVRIRAEM